jgi:hypothetical protein
VAKLKKDFCKQKPVIREEEEISDDDMLFENRPAKRNKQDWLSDPVQLYMRGMAQRRIHLQTLQQQALQQVASQASLIK